MFEVALRTEECVMTTTDVSTQQVLVCGASFAGLTTAIWMQRLGYDVTVVEKARGLRKGGTPVDLTDDVMAILDRMGVLAAVQARALPPRLTTFAHLDGTPIATLGPEAAATDGAEDDAPRHDGVEIHRDDLLDILFAALGDTTEVVFGESITDLTETREGVRADFRSGRSREFAMVLGCDGLHSTVRRLTFGPEAEFSRFLHHYASVTVVDGALLEPWTTRIQNAPGMTLVANAYGSTSDVIFVFRAEAEIGYDHHDLEEQKRIVLEHVAGAGAPFTDVLGAALGADDFYFDKLSQIHMPAWSSGRVVLVGDAAYCPSPAAGMGGSTAILGATALHDALADTGGDVAAAFSSYERAFRPIAEEIQADVLSFGLPMIFPDTAEAIAARDARLVEQR
jgi:2-polyprenyl-6-methoxyphenol hydroxylase-like FAD-dependent oxidoreductase